MQQILTKDKTRTTLIPLETSTGAQTLWGVYLSPHSKSDSIDL